jgi:hypothetical protein
MGRTKNRNRYDAMKRLNPDYKGFRGYGFEPSRPGQAPIIGLMCIVCKRKRNVPIGIAEEQNKQFVCNNCQDRQK